MRRSAHALTILSVCSTVVYFSLYNRTFLWDFFENVNGDDVGLLGVSERRGYRDGFASERVWSYRSRQDTPETSLKRLALGLFDALPGEFSAKYKNPCWEVGKRKPRQCLPYFYLIGMPKCGTTDVWNKLTGHPQVVNISKEPHWWSRVRMAKIGRYRTKLTVDPRTYYTRFANALNTYASWHNLSRSKLVVGDGSASTMWDNQHWRLFYPGLPQGPPHVNGELIVTIQPNALAIAILRNPTDRLYSDYLFFTNKSSLSPEHFHERVKASIAMFHECVTKLDLRTCTYNTSSIRKYVRIEVGLYSVYMSDWLSFFPRRRLKVITMEDWHQNCLKTLIELYDFLELERISTSSVYRICTNDIQNTRSPDKLVLGPMLAKTRQMLDDFYSPFNKELAGLLRSSKFLWKREDVEDD